MKRPKGEEHRGVQKMSLVLKRGTTGVQMHMTQSDQDALATPLARPNRSDPAPVPVPRVRSKALLRYDAWLERYSGFLDEYVDMLWSQLNRHGIHTRHAGFKAGLLSYIYRTSASRYAGFIFLGK